MNFLSFIYRAIFYEPILFLFFFFFFSLEDLGLAIILLAFLIRLIFLPLSVRVIKNEKRVEEIQLQISEIEKKYKEDPKKKTLEILSLYKKEGFNPLFSFLLLIFQFPVLYSVYQILKQPQIFSSATFLNFIDLTKPNLLFPAIAGGLQVFQILRKKNPSHFFALFSVFFLIFVLTKLPAAVSLYVLANFLFGILERFLVLKKI